VSACGGSDLNFWGSLDHHSLRLEGGPFTGFTCVVRLLSQGDAKGPGIDRHLGDKPVTAVLSLHRGAPQGLAVTHQLVQTLAPTWDLTDDPGLEHIRTPAGGPCCSRQASAKRYRYKEGGIGGPALEIQAQRLVQLLPMLAGKGLQITGAAAAAQNPQHRHQQQEPLGLAHPTGEPPIRNGLEEVDVIARSALIVCGEIGFGHGAEPFPPTEPMLAATPISMRTDF
jgi:hypothetical protein